MKTITRFIYAAFAAVALAVGAVTANGAVNDLYASVNGDTHNGGGFIYEYNPGGVQSTFAAGLSRPRGVAFDHSGNLFVVTNTFDSVSGTFQPSIVKITPDGVQSTFGTISGDFFGSGLAMDASGNIFIMAVDDTSATGAATIYKFTPAGVQSTFGSIPGQGFGLAFDSADNLFAADGFDRTIYKFAPDGTRSVFVDPSGFTPLSGPGGLAFDRFGNLFVSTESGEQEPDSILKFSPDGVGSPFATDLTEPRGLAFDRGGNLFVAEILQDGPGDILKFTPNGVGTLFASGIGSGANGGPEYLAVQLLPISRPRPTPHPRPTQQF